jgi:hypothetical protein
MRLFRLFPAPAVAVHPSPGGPPREAASDRRPVTRSAAPSWASPRLRSSCSAPARETTRRNAPPCEPPLVGFVENTPPPTCLRCVHSRRTSPPGLGPPGATREHHVPPAWFRTTSAACSASKVAGLLHPAADPGVRRVSGHLARPTEAGRSGGCPSPRRRIALRRIPLAGSRTVSPRPLPPCRSNPTTGTGSGPPKRTPTPPSGAPTGIAADRTARKSPDDFGALLHRRVRNVEPPLPATRRPILPWVSSPSEVLRGTAPEAGPLARNRPRDPSRGSPLPVPAGVCPGPKLPASRPATSLGFRTSKSAPRSASSVATVDLWLPPRPLPSSLPALAILACATILSGLLRNRRVRITPSRTSQQSTASYDTTSTR